MKRIRRIGTGALLVGLVIGGPFWAHILAQGTPTRLLPDKQSGPSGIDPRSDALLKQMAAYLTGLPSFTVRATNTLQVILVSGEKLDFEAVSEVSVRRPDRMRSRRAGVAGSADFFYDGRTVTIFDRGTKFFTVNQAPPSIDGMLPALADLLGVDVPGADLLFTDVYDGLMAEVTQAHYVAMEDVGGVRTHHLAFRGREVDWQIWIEDGERPLPRRYLITTKWMTGAPQFGVALNEWNVSPRLDDKTFIFEAPPDGRKIDVFGPRDTSNRSLGMSARQSAILNRGART